MKAKRIYKTVVKNLGKLRKEQIIQEIEQILQEEDPLDEHKEFQYDLDEEGTPLNQHGVQVYSGIHGWLCQDEKPNRHKCQIQCSKCRDQQRVMEHDTGQIYGDINRKEVSYE